MGLTPTGEFHHGALVDVDTAIGVLRGRVVERTIVPDGVRYAVRIEVTAQPQQFARGVLCAVSPESMTAVHSYDTPR